MTLRVATYVRVSTTGHGQTTENQTRELLEACKKNGWEIVAEFTDNGISGAKDRTKRPGLDALWRAVSAREVDVVAVWAIDRLGRSLQQLVSFMETLKASQVDLYVHTQGIDTTTPAGRAMYHMIGVFAEFERGMIQSRIKSGLARARENGTKFGRPRSGRDAEVRELVERGVSGPQIRAVTGVGFSMIDRIRKENEAKCTS